MAIIKSYTDIEQSRKLAEILPLESADMYYFHQIDNAYFPPDVESIYPIPLFKDGKEDFNYDIPCWSLASLLGIIQKTTPYKMEHFGDKKVQLTCVIGDKPWELIISDFDNEVDACVAMIELLHEQKLL